MTRHHSSADLIRIEALRGMQRSQAQAAAVEALATERRVLAQLEWARAERDEALARWHEQLSSPGFSPEMATALAGALNRSDEGAASAGEAADRAASERAECDYVWRQSDAHCRQAASLLATSRRREARKRDEKAIEVAADRMALVWRRQ